MLMTDPLREGTAKHMTLKGRIVIDSERCKGCDLCASVCPHQAIHMAETFNAKGYRPAEWIDADTVCTGCATCAMICPDAAITVYRETALRAVPAAPTTMEQ
jgi:2-oxoglutarate ferredoxin oxidoreductase subunit delta